MTRISSKIVVSFQAGLPQIGQWFAYRLLLQSLAIGHGKYYDSFVMTMTPSCHYGVLLMSNVGLFQFCAPPLVGISSFSCLGFNGAGFRAAGRLACSIWPGGNGYGHDPKDAGIWSLG